MHRLERIAAHLLPDKVRPISDTHRHSETDCMRTIVHVRYRVLEFRHRRHPAALIRARKLLFLVRACQPQYQSRTTYIINQALLVGLANRCRFCSSCTTVAPRTYPPPPHHHSNPHVRELSLYDVVNTPGVGADLGHIDSAAKVNAYVGQEQLGEALYGCDLVLIPAGVPRKPGMTRDDLFNINAGMWCLPSCRYSSYVVSLMFY